MMPLRRRRQFAPRWFAPPTLGLNCLTHTRNRLISRSPSHNTGVLRYVLFSQMGTSCSKANKVPFALRFDTSPLGSSGAVRGVMNEKLISRSSASIGVYADQKTFVP